MRDKLSIYIIFYKLGVVTKAIKPYHEKNKKPELINSQWNSIIAK